MIRPPPSLFLSPGPGSEVMFGPPNQVTGLRSLVHKPQVRPGRGPSGASPAQALAGWGDGGRDAVVRPPFFIISQPRSLDQELYSVPDRIDGLRDVSPGLPRSGAGDLRGLAGPGPGAG